MLKQTLIIFTFLTVLFSNAQLKEKFDKGFIINKSKDTIEGYIKAADLSNFSSGICFKKNLEEKECKTYGNNQILSFKTYTNDSFDLLDLKMDNRQNAVKIFAKLIFKEGGVSLYKSVHKSEIFYVILNNNEKYILQNDKLFTGENKLRTYNYKGILNFATEGFVNNNNLKAKFDEDTFIDILVDYNLSKGKESNYVKVKEKSTNFLIATAGLGFEKNSSEYYGQLMYRKYLPKISRSTSFNIGINYFNNQYTSRNKDYTLSLFSVPIQIQQNFLNKNIRPYIFAGISLDYVQIKDDANVSVLTKGFQKNYGLNMLYGAGIEMDVFDEGIYIKIEYRKQGYTHPILFGIGYVFKNM